MNPSMLNELLPLLATAASLIFLNMFLEPSASKPPPSPTKLTDSLPIPGIDMMIDIMIKDMERNREQFMIKLEEAARSEFDFITGDDQKIEWIQQNNKRLADASKYDGWDDEERGY